MPVDLNDRVSVTSNDPKGMLGLTEDFPAQCRRALGIAREVELPAAAHEPNLVLLSGLGGSAAGGDFARALFEAHGAVPFVVNRDYHVPAFVGLGDIVFCASYSGNTEETLAAYEEAKHTGARIICVTSGGRLREMAEEDGNPVYVVPGDQPPRTALGYMLVPVLVACERLKLIPEQDYETAFSLLERVAGGLAPETRDNPAMKLAQAYAGSLPILYGLGSWQGVIANRWKGQINENAKRLAYANSFPELNHNEILGWVGAKEQGVAKYVVTVLQDGTESEKMKTRAKVTERLVGDAAEFHSVQAEGETLLERMLSLAYFGDFVSLYLAALGGVDPETIESINTLKGELAKVE